LSSTGIPDLAGMVAVITGASRGLGAGMAVHFAQAGLQLGLCARHRPGDTGSVNASDGSPLWAELDVTDHGALADFADQVVARFGGIDLWVNNAGLLGPIGPLAGANPDEAATNIAVNVTGVLHGSALFARHVASRPGGGVLINISSGAGSKPYAGWGPYGASKAAVDQLTRVIALEGAADGLRAYAVAPGVVDTDMQAAIRQSTEAAFPEVERFRRLALNGGFNSPAWVAEHLLALALAFGPERPDQVLVRLPDQPRRGRAG
jgi:NAD(P)-dependent dehydrogenase (short-subunit alcohol dehydrogenase family)